MSADFRVLGCDPGKVNFAYAVYGPDGLDGHGVIDGAETVGELDLSNHWFDKILRWYEPDACCIERFHQRPGKGGSGNLELVNLVIGEARKSCKIYGIPCKLITAPTHKSWTPRIYKGEVQQVTYKKKGKIKTKYDLTTYKEWKGLPTEHEVDAANLAKYGHEHVFKDFLMKDQGEQEDAEQRQHDPFETWAVKGNFP